MAKKYPDLTVMGIPRNWIAVTPNDSADNLTATSNDSVIGLYIGGTAGNVVVTIEGADKTIPVAANSYVWVTGATRVKSTSTTATPIFSLVI